MIVAVVAVRMMQPAVDKVIEVVAVRNHLVSAIDVVTLAVNRLALVGIRVAYLDTVFVVMIFVRMMQVAAVQVIDMAFVLNTRVATVLAVNVLVSVVYFVFH